MSWIAVAIGGSAVLGAGASLYGANKLADAAEHAGNVSTAIYEQEKIAQREATERAEDRMAPFYNTSVSANAALGQTLGLPAGGGYTGGTTSGGGTPAWGRGGWDENMNLAYLSQYPDVASGWDNSPQQHYDMYGRDEIAQGLRAGRGGAGTLPGEGDSGTGFNIDGTPITGQAAPGGPDYSNLGPAPTPNYDALGEQPGMPSYSDDPDSPDYDSLHKPGDPDYSLEAFEESPGYNFLKSQMTRGLRNEMAAKGLVTSGRFYKELLGRSADLASLEFGNWWNRTRTAGRDKATDYYADWDRERLAGRDDQIDFENDRNFARLMGRDSAQDYQNEWNRTRTTGRDAAQDYDAAWGRARTEGQDSLSKYMQTYLNPLIGLANPNTGMAMAGIGTQGAANQTNLATAGADAYGNSRLAASAAGTAGWMGAAGAVNQGVGNYLSYLANAAPPNYDYGQADLPIFNEPPVDYNFQW